jgi:arginyl-tRNA synthetase
VTPAQLSDLVVASLTELSAEGAITCRHGLPQTVTVERPRQKGHGDYATNAALQLAKQAVMAPRELAALIAEPLQTGSPGSR